MLKNVFYHSWVTIAGPCAVESENQILDIAKKLISINENVILRGGIWKPRTLPSSWQGSGNIAIEWMVNAKKETGIKIATEVGSVDQANLALKAGFDLIWIGSRNSQSYNLLEEIGKLTTNNDIPIILKRGMSASLEEWIGSADYIRKYHSNIILCERGIRGYSPDTRNILDLQTAFLAQQKTGLPVIIDPSHAAGRRDLIIPMCLAAKAVGLNGIMVEVHPYPDEAMTDSNQQIDPTQFQQLTRMLFMINSPSICFS